MILVVTSLICSFRPISKPCFSTSKRLRKCTLGLHGLPNLFVRSIHYQPLRILFCGADELSIVSLRALHNESQRSPSNVASIDVVCRPGKPTGRGLKQIRHPPIKAAAEELGLPVHQINTFTGWKLPINSPDLLPQVDLIVAVSFGLLVPPRILNGTTYGGINVHPSLLPSFRGPAPLHWIMLRGETHTGVTLQTLHPSKFDEGVVLDQTPEPGVPIPNPTSYTFADLQSMSAAMAAEMLVKGVRERSFIPPCQDVRKGRGNLATRATSFAPKIESRTRCLDFQSMGSSQILRMNRAITPLWAAARLESDDSTTSLIFGSDMDLAAENYDQDCRVISSIEPGLPYMILDDSKQFNLKKAPLFINTVDGRTLEVPTLKMPGTTRRPAAALAQAAGLFAEPSLDDGEIVRTFREPLIVPDDTRQYLASLWHSTEATI